MKKNFNWLLLFALSFVVLGVSAQDVVVYLKTNHVDVYPSDVVKNTERTATHLNITLNNDSVVAIDLSEVDSITNQVYKEFPVFTSFKFNNKYNDQVFADVEATITPDKVTATVGAIGKRLTPSFKLSDENAKAWVNGVEQTTKVSRPRFDGEVVYTLGYDGWTKLNYRKVADEVWSEETPERVMENIELTGDMLSTNAPSNYNEGLENIIDGENSTFFHSTWGEGLYAKLPLNECPYIDISLNEDIQNFQFGYATRYDTDNRIPTSFLLQFQDEYGDWVDIKTYTAEDGIPQTGIGQIFESDLIRLDNPCRNFRLTMLTAYYKNYLCLSEFWMNKLVYEGEPQPPQLISPAKYEYSRVPYGRDVKVNISWPTDTAKVPHVYIYTDNGQLPADKVTYLKSYIRIDGAGVYPDFADSVSIRGRGNSSWAGQYGKSPYRLKFDSSKKPFGLTKGKSWVLLANRQTGSMLSNAIGMKIASMVETAGANRIIPIELYINDQYRGSYNFTQQVGLSNNSIDLPDETNAVLLELDDYFDEDYRFRSDYYNLPVNVKDPDLVDYADDEAQFQLIKDDFNNFVDILYNRRDEYVDYVDVEMLARFLLVNELVQNLELGHPKSTFLYKEDLLALHSRYVFGPVWDFDWGFGYEKNYEYCTGDPTYDYFERLIGRNGYDFFNNLRFKSEEVKRAYYKEWTDFMNLHLDELLEFVEDYYQYANNSFINNAWTWGDGYNYEEVKNNSIDWLNRRANHIYQSLDVYDLEEPLPISRGDVNSDGVITIADVVCVVNFLLGLENETFIRSQADIDADMRVNLADMVRIVGLAMSQPELSQHYVRRDIAEATLTPQSFSVLPGADADCYVNLQVDVPNYVALQFDLTLPDGFTLEEVLATGELSSYQPTFIRLNDNVYRVAFYSDASQPIQVGSHDLRLVLRASNGPVNSPIVSTSSVLATNKLGEDLRLSPRSARVSLETTGVGDLFDSFDMKGGDALYLETTHGGKLPVYSIDGRCVKVVEVSAGKNVIQLPAGVYVVKGQKILISK